MDTGGERHQRAAGQLRLRPATAADDRRLRAADRMRQSGELDAGARHGAPAADCGTTRAWSAALQTHPADVDREPGGCTRGERGGSPAVSLRLARDAGHGTGGHAIVALFDLALAA